MFPILEEAIDEALLQARNAQGAPGASASPRELALVVTKLQEARHWLREAQGRI